MNEKLKPFDLEAAKAGEPVQTSDGRDVRIICFDVKSNAFPIMGLLMNSHGEEYCLSYTINGRYCPESLYNSNSDLFMKPVKKTYWVNVYKNTNHKIRTGESVHSSKEMAIVNKLICANEDYLGAFPIEIEE